MSIVRKYELSFWLTKGRVIRTHFIRLLVDGPLFVGSPTNLRKGILNYQKAHFLVSIFRPGSF